MTDVRHALRMLVKNRAFTIVAVLTLALGIGANTVVFSVINAAIFRRLPFAEADRLMMIAETDARDRPGGVSPANYLDWRRDGSAHAMLAAKVDWSAYNLASDPGPEQVIGTPVSAGIFSLLRVLPIAGRAFFAEEDQPGAAPVVILGHALWQRRFQGDRHAVGRTLEVDGTPHTIVGIMPAGFYLNREAMSLAEADQLWLPLAQQLGAAGMNSRTMQNLRVWARLAPGVSREVAQARFEQIQRRLQQEFPAENGSRGVRVLPLEEWRSERVRRVYGLFGNLARGRRYPTGHDLWRNG